jgi:predicted acetyltransferase
MTSDPYIAKRYTYVHYDGQGKPDSYLIFQAKLPEPWDRNNLIIEELAWTTKAGLLDMFGFIGGLRPQFGKVFWEAPDDINLFSLFPEAWDIILKGESSVMTRIIDLPEALARMCPQKLTKGQVTIDVVDKSMPCNNGKYALTWENGSVNVSLAETGQTPDMSTTIEAMAQMVIGYMTPDQAAYRKDTTIHNQHEALTALFPKKNLYLWERF